MALQFPPQGTPGWFRMAEQIAHQHDTDIQRLWSLTPMVPDPVPGVPFTGPTSPDLFFVPASTSSLGSQSSYLQSSTSSA